MAPRAPGCAGVRVVACTRHPPAAYCLANSNPMPRLAPIIIAVGMSPSLSGVSFHRLVVFSLVCWPTRHELEPPESSGVGLVPHDNTCRPPPPQYDWSCPLPKDLFRTCLSALLPPAIP